MNKDLPLKPLMELLQNLPAIKPGIGCGYFEDGTWWTKFQIDIEHPLAWHVVQELGHILNYISVTEPLPAVFKPVSPPVYLNGGPKEFLAWVIESTTVEFTPALCAEWLIGRLPSPIDDMEQWALDEDAAV